MEGTDDEVLQKIIGWQKEYGVSDKGMSEIMDILSMVTTVSGEKLVRTMMRGF